ncbi:MAG TPA: hypothetical protein PLW35_12365, partial [Verrucomicrobiota bacterium]|nr:hypothetical protein [Verrucomicrobiota bacterium]
FYEKTLCSTENSSSGDGLFGASGDAAPAAVRVPPLGGTVTVGWELPGSAASSLALIKVVFPATELQGIFPNMVRLKVRGEEPEALPVRRLWFPLRRAGKWAG